VKFIANVIIGRARCFLDLAQVASAFMPNCQAGFFCCGPAAWVLPNGRGGRFGRLGALERDIPVAVFEMKFVAICSNMPQCRKAAVLLLNRVEISPN